MHGLGTLLGEVIGEVGIHVALAEQAKPALFDGAAIGSDERIATAV